MMKRRDFTFLAFSVAAGLLVAVPGTASADGVLGAPETTVPFGTFGGIEYVRHQGWFEGASSNGAYRVPYQITAPVEPARGNRTLVVEPPHFAVPNVSVAYLGFEFFFERGFSHAQVGWGTLGTQSLDPAAFAAEGYITAGPAPCSGGLCPGPTDFEIVADFTNVLKSDSLARQLLGRVRRVYSIGSSNSTEPVHALLHSEAGQGLFDLSFLITTPVAEHAIPATGHEVPRGAGRVVMLVSEADVVMFNAAALREPRKRHPGYRVYEAAGAPHIPNNWNPDRPNPLGNDWTPFLRSLFAAADRWSRHGCAPPRSVWLKREEAGVIDPVYGVPTGIARDEDGNARGGIRAPDLAVGRYHYLAADFAFLPLYGNVVDLACEPRPDGSARFRNHGAYVSRFVRQANRLRKRGFLLPADWRAAVMEATHSDVGKPGTCP